MTIHTIYTAVYMGVIYFAECKLRRIFKPDLKILPNLVSWNGSVENMEWWNPRSD